MTCKEVYIDSSAYSDDDELESFNFQNWKKNYDAVVHQLREKMDADTKKSILSQASIEHHAEVELSSSYSSMELTCTRTTTISVDSARKSRKTNIFPDDIEFDEPKAKRERTVLRKLDVNTMEMIEEQSSFASTPGSRRSSLGLVSLTSSTSLNECTIDLMMGHDSIYKSQKLPSLPASVAGSRRTSLNSSASPSVSKNNSNHEDGHRIEPHALTFDICPDSTLKDPEETSLENGALMEQIIPKTKRCDDGEVLPKIIPGSVKTVRVLRARPIRHTNKAVTSNNKNLKEVKFSHVIEKVRELPSPKRTVSPVIFASKRGKTINPEKRTLITSACDQVPTTDINKNKLEMKTASRNKATKVVKLPGGTAQRTMKPTSSRPITPVRTRSTRNLRTCVLNTIGSMDQKSRSSSLAEETKNDSKITSQAASKKVRLAPEPSFRQSPTPISKPSIIKPPRKMPSGPRPPTPALRRGTRSRMTVVTQDPKPDSSRESGKVDRKESKTESPKTTSRSGSRRSKINASGETAFWRLGRDTQQTSTRKRVTRSQKTSGATQASSEPKTTTVKRSAASKISQSHTRGRSKVGKTIEQANDKKENVTRALKTETEATVVSHDLEENKPKEGRRSRRISILVTKVKRSRLNRGSTTPQNRKEGEAVKTRRKHVSDSSKPDRMCGLSGIRFTRKKASTTPPQ